MVHFNVRKELFPLKGIVSIGKVPFLFPSKITKNNGNIILMYFLLTYLRCNSKGIARRRPESTGINIFPSMLKLNW